MLPLGYRARPVPLVRRHARRRYRPLAASDSPKPRGFHRSAQSSPGHPTRFLCFDRALVYPIWIPAIQAVMQHAIVPPSMARIPCRRAWHACQADSQHSTVASVFPSSRRHRCGIGLARTPWIPRGNCLFCVIEPSKSLAKSEKGSAQMRQEIVLLIEWSARTKILG